MKNNRLLEVSLPTNNEKRIIDIISKSDRNNRNMAQILANTNSLLLARTDVELYQLYAMLIKDFILNRYNGKVNYNIEMDELINALNMRTDIFAKENICLLMQYLEVDDFTRFALASNYVDTLSQKYNRYQGIKEKDEALCIMFCENLNKVIETKMEKKNTHKVYRFASSK